jgi:hypothetical protein
VREEGIGAPLVQRPLTSPSAVERGSRRRREYVSADSVLDQLIEFALAASRGLYDALGDRFPSSAVWPYFRAGALVSNPKKPRRFRVE